MTIRPRRSNPSKGDRVRVDMPRGEADQLLQLGEIFVLHAIEEDHGWATFKVQSDNMVTSSAPPLGGARPKWIRTSFRDEAVQHARAVELAHSLNLTYCQWLRMLEAQELEKFGYINARRRPRYVG